MQLWLYGRSHPDDNHYAHPIDVVVLVDLNLKKARPIPLLTLLTFDLRALCPRYPRFVAAATPRHTAGVFCRKGSAGHVRQLQQGQRSTFHRHTLHGLSTASRAVPLLAPEACRALKDVNSHERLPAAWCVLQVVQVDKPYKGSGKQWEMPTVDDNYHRNLQDKPWRSTLKPLNIDQPEGPSFQVSHALGNPPGIGASQLSQSRA